MKPTVNDLVREIQEEEGECLHNWRFTDKCCAWCVKCEAESYYGEIVKEGELICPWCLDNSKSCNACDDSYEGEK